MPLVDLLGGAGDKQLLCEAGEPRLGLLKDVALHIGGVMEKRRAPPVGIADVKGREIDAVPSAAD